jgi:ferrous iron transport protein B
MATMSARATRASRPRISMALAGNPNAGKTTLFNTLTGDHQHVGNWPGKTIQRREGVRHSNGTDIHIIDLPGTYSLTTHSIEETLAREVLFEHRPDVVLAVVDAANLERNLYLVLQLLEMEVNLVVALNMMDVAHSRGASILTDELSIRLGGIPVIPTVATRGLGMLELERRVIEASAGQHDRQPFRLNYGTSVEPWLQQIEQALSTQASNTSPCPLRWMAVKLLEGDRQALAQVHAAPGGQEVLKLAEMARASLEAEFSGGVDLELADRRYQYLHALSHVVLKGTPRTASTNTDRIDSILTNAWTGIPIFLAVMYIAFGLVVNVSSPFLEWIDASIHGPISAWAGVLLAELQAPAWLVSLVMDGVIAGVGGVLVFLPGLIILFIFISLLEESGYLARAAFVMDRVMSLIGLHGKSFVPMMLGFGCGVPAIYATRTLESHKDRLLTGLLVPLMSCSARLPVYLIFTLAFFPRHSQLIIWGLYALGVVVAGVMGGILGRLLFRTTRRSPFVLELPPYRWPSLRNLRLTVLSRTNEFLRNAGTIILGVSVAVWLLTHLPWGAADLRHSYFGRLSAALAPALEPAGFGTWQAAGALATGFVAKEMVISTMAQIYLGEDGSAAVAPAPDLLTGLQQIGGGFLQAAAHAGQQTAEMFTPGINLFPAEETELEGGALLDTLTRAFSPPAALAFIVFVLLYVPCGATLAALRHEFGGRYAALSAVYQTGVAWIGAVAVYQLGLAIGLG